MLLELKSHMKMKKAFQSTKMLNLSIGTGIERNSTVGKIENKASAVRIVIMHMMLCSK